MNQRRGIVLLVVLAIIAVLGLLAGTFAFLIRGMCPPWPRRPIASSWVARGRVPHLQNGSAAARGIFPALRPARDGAASRSSP